jgi:hypothetical protein
MKVTILRTALGLVLVVALAGALTISASPQCEPKAVLVKSNSPEVAKTVAEALAKSEFKEADYKISLPKSGNRAAIARGALSRTNIVQLEREVTGKNRNFGTGVSDVIVLVKVITRGSVAEQIIKDALRGIDSKLYQLEVVR